MRRFWPAACAVLLLAGCATTPLSREPLSASAQEALLRDLPGFRFEGRAGARVGEEGFNVPSLSWRQQAAETRLQLSGPLAVGGVTLQYSPGTLQVTNGRGEEFSGDEAAAILGAQLGFVPPFEALRYWVLGLAAPGESPTHQQTNAHGRNAEFTQRGWHIRYERWTAIATRAGEVQVPQRLTATRDDLRLRLVVDRWNLRASD